MGDCLIRNRARSRMPRFTYSGQYSQHDDGDGNWRIKFLTSGTLTFLANTSIMGGIDVFLVGGGGGGANHPYDNARAGGGGGYTKTQKNVSVTKNTDYSIVIGSAGKESSAFGYKAAGGTGGWIETGTSQGGWWWQGVNGNGGSGGWGGVDGGNGYQVSGGGRGQKEFPGPNGETGTTREFGEAAGDLYSSGGVPGLDHSPNTGNGGWPQSASTPGETASGCSGIVIIRNAR